MLKSFFMVPLVGYFVEVARRGWVRRLRFPTRRTGLSPKRCAELHTRTRKAECLKTWGLLSFDRKVSGDRHRLDSGRPATLVMIDGQSPPSSSAGGLAPDIRFQ